MSRLRVTLLCLLPVVFPTGVARSAENGWTLVKDWQVSLGSVPEGHPFYRAAICADGTNYLSDALGRVVELDVNGKVVSDVQFPELNALAVSCDDESHLIAAPAGEIRTIGLGSDGSLKVIRSTPMPDPRAAWAIAPAGSYGFFVLGLGLEKTTAFVHLVDKQGVVVTRREAAASGTPAAISAALNGSLAWDRVSQQVLYIPSNPYVFTRYHPARGLVGSTPRNDPNFHVPRSGGIAAGVDSRGDRVVRAAYLPNGDVLVQVLKEGVVFNSQVRQNVVHGSGYMELFDHDLNLKATGISVRGFGLFSGAAQDGSLYFNFSSTPDGGRVVKAHLVGPS